MKPYITVAPRNRASPSIRSRAPTPPPMAPVERATTPVDSVASISAFELRASRDALQSPIFRHMRMEQLLCLRHQLHGLANQVPRVGAGLGGQLLRAAEHVVAGVDAALRIERELVQFAKASGHRAAGV